MSSILNGLLRRFTGGEIHQEKIQCGRRPRVSLAVERLEDRLALSWTGAPPSVIPTGGAIRVNLNNFGNANGSAYISSNEVDLYAIDTTQLGVYRFSATTPFSYLDTVLGVFNAAGQRLAFNDDIASTNYDSQVTITLAAGQRYYFGITNYTGTPGGSYSWYVDGPQPIVDDPYEDNDTLGTAVDVGTPNTPLTMRNLALNDANDYFRFRLASAGNAASSASVDFVHNQGNLNLALYNSQGTLIRSSTGFIDDERVSLNGLAAGVYVIRVYGYSGDHNPNYSLIVDPGVTQGTGNRVLYLSFDGANISRSDLIRWAGTDWSGSVNELDADRNGITVQPFLRNRSDRETIINRVLTLVREDLSVFGITVQRRTGLAVEGVGATTIFLGVSTLSYDLYHVAADVDFGNNNRTDIAFVGDENWGSVELTALAMADVTLHEAGHTWGLYHVSSGSNPESMGLRYSVSNQNLWAVNTRFMNQTFAEYVDGWGPHGGGRGPQNSYQVMARTFGASGGSSGSGGQPGNLRSFAAAGLAVEPQPEAGVAANRPTEHSSGCCCPVCSRRVEIDKYLVLEDSADLPPTAHPITFNELPITNEPAPRAFPETEVLDRVWSNWNTHSASGMRDSRLVAAALVFETADGRLDASSSALADLSDAGELGDPLPDHLLGVFADLRWLRMVG